MSKLICKIALVLLWSIPVLGIAHLDYFDHLPDHVPDFKTIDTDINQDINRYVDKKDIDQPLIVQNRQEAHLKNFFQHYYSPWENTDKSYAENHLKNEEGKLVNSFSHNLGYDENFHLHPRQWFKTITDDMDLPRFPNFNQAAIAVDNAYIRLFPTNLPHFGNYRVPGQGYPFDDFQNSAISVGTPLRIVHLSKDKDWAYVFTPEVSGWIEMKNIAYVDKDFIKEWKQKQFTASIKREISVSDQSGIFRFHAFLGTVLPLKIQSEIAFTVLLPIRNMDGQAVIRYADVSKKDFVLMPWLPTKRHLVELIDQQLGVPYGWGGLYFYSDCSSVLKQIFSPLGIWLPRNSKAQSEAYTHQSIENLSPKERRDTILKEGKPYMTLIFVTGHVMLYIGEYQGDVLTFQNLWAFASMSANGRLGRDVIGKALLMPLKLSYGKTGMFPQIDGEHMTLTYLN